MELSPEIERWVREEIRLGHFHAAEDAIEQVASALIRDKSPPDQPSIAKPKLPWCLGGIYRPAFLKSG